MGTPIGWPGRTQNKALWISDKRLYLTADDQVVGEKDPRKLTLLVAAGGSITIAQAQRYGLLSQPVEQPAPVAEPAVVQPEGVEPVTPTKKKK